MLLNIYIYIYIYIQILRSCTYAQFTCILTHLQYIYTCICIIYILIYIGSLDCVNASSHITPCIYIYIYVSLIYIGSLDCVNAVLSCTPATRQIMVLTTQTHRITQNQSIYLSIYLYLLIYLSIYLSLYLSIYLSIDDGHSTKAWFDQT